MKFTQSPLTIIGILCAVIWLGCDNDDDRRVNHFTIGGSLLISPKIAFMSERGGNADIYVMNADGTDVVNITNHETIDYYPAWSPDGTRITFGAKRGDNAEIYVMNTDGTDKVNLTNNPEYNDNSPTWGLIR